MPYYKQLVEEHQNLFQLFELFELFELFFISYVAVLFMRNFFSPPFAGAIDPHCDVPIIVEDAFENARYLCEQYYMDSPQLELVEKNASKESGQSYFLLV